LIATATFGSALAPEVQFLRDFRDQKLDRTFAGYNFMMAFNLWYYSFSPSVAGTINVSPQIQGIMRVLLTPLISLLRVSEAVFDLFSFQPELAAILAGLVASGLLGAVYLSIPSIIVFRRHRGMVGRLLKPLGVILGGALITLAAAELLVNSFLAASGSVVLVLANMVLFAALPEISLDIYSKLRLLVPRRSS
jgi:hypothetical protein